MEKIGDLHLLKRPDLQKLAKEYGIKANLRNVKLIEALECKIKAAASSPPKRSSIQSSITPMKPLSPLNNLSSASDQSIEGLLSLDSVQPLWNDLSNCELLSDDSFTVKPQKLVKKSPVKNTSESKENIKGQVKPSAKNLASNSKTPRILRNRSKTPTSEMTKLQLGKTFSIPKKRSRTRVSIKETTPATKRQQKRKLSTSNSKAKRSKADDAELKKSMIDNVVREIEQKTGHVSELRSFLPGRKIPVFTAAGVAVIKPSSSSSNQKFSKIHEKTFGKMESIDDYQKRKEQRAEKLFGSAKQKQKVDRLAKPKTPRIVKPVTRPKPSFTSPKSMIPPSSRKSTIKKTAFKPAVFSTSKMNTNFSAKVSKLSTPKKVAVSFAQSPRGKPNSPRTPAVRKRTSSAPRKSLTPFRPNTTINTPQSAKKNAFNLQESLKKPLSYVPHKGPLKKFEDPKPTFKDRMKNIKKTKVSTREDRRQKVKVAREASKSDKMMKRRGIK